MSAKHTPGPWERRWTSSSDGERTEETGRIVHERLGIICHLVMTDNVDADARLIRATPDLLAALMETVGALRAIDASRAEPDRRYGDELYQDQLAAVAELRRVIAVGQAAIDKATKGNPNG